MAGKKSEKNQTKFDFALTFYISSSMLITTSYGLPMSSLSSSSNSKHFIIAKPPDERQPEAIEQGIEQIPNSQTPAPPEPSQPIEFPAPTTVSSPETPTFVQPQLVEPSPSPTPPDNDTTTTPFQPTLPNPEPNVPTTTPTLTPPTAPEPANVTPTLTPPTAPEPANVTPTPAPTAPKPANTTPILTPPTAPEPVNTTPTPASTKRPAPKLPSRRSAPRVQPQLLESTPTPKPAIPNSAPRPSRTIKFNPIPKPSNRNYTPQREENRQPSYPASPVPRSKKLNLKEINFVDVKFGVLAPGDFKSKGRYFHFYQFEGRENQLIQIRLTGSVDRRHTNNLSLDPLMFLIDSNNRVIFTKGSKRTANGQVQDAFAFVRLPASGKYTIAVTSRNPRDIGRYSLALRNDRASYTLDKSGRLTAQSSSLRKNGSADNISKFQGKKDQLISIRVDSTFEEFSPYIMLVNSRGQIVAKGNEKDGRYSALIDRAKLPEDDVYYVVVASAIPQQHGAYRLTVF